MSEGFFKDSSLAEVPVLAGCGRCRLRSGCFTPKMEPTGKGARKILIVAEAPGATEDKRGVQLVGECGQYLRRILREELDVDLDRDCRKTNSVRCRPPENRAPKDPEIAACRAHIWKEIEANHPRVIILLGGSALKSWLWGRWKKKKSDGIMAWRGFAVPDPKANAWVIPTFHPSFMIREEHNDAREVLFIQDLRKALAHLDKPLPVYKPVEDCLEILMKPRQAVEYLRGLLQRSPKMIAMDYEATGLKPHRKGHEIVCCAISESIDHSTAFPVGQDPAVKEALGAVLREKHIKKIAANLKYEQAWSMVHLGVKVRGWIWDTVLAAHALDNREGITSVKFQAAVRFGIFDYDSHIEPYLKGVDKKDQNSLNRIHEVDNRELLTYCATDSLLEHRMALEQMKELPCETN